MNRRGFLGSVIGLVAATTPFKALLIGDRIQDRSEYPFQLGLITADGTIQSPGIESITHVGKDWIFKARPLLVTHHEMRHIGVILTGEAFSRQRLYDHYQINANYIHGDILARPGDKLIVEYKMCFNGSEQIATIDELQRFIVKHSHLFNKDYR